MYQMKNNVYPVQKQEPVVQIPVVQSKQFTTMVGFAKVNQCAPVKGLTTYYTTLTDRYSPEIDTTDPK